MFCSVHFYQNLASEWVKAKLPDGVFYENIGSNKRAFFVSLELNRVTRVPTVYTAEASVQKKTRRGGGGWRGGIHFSLK